MASALGEFVYAFQNAAEYTLVSKFSEIRKLNPVQEEALMEFMQQKDVLPTGCGPLILIIKENTQIMFTEWRFSYHSEPFQISLISLCRCVR